MGDFRRFSEDFRRFSGDFFRRTPLFGVFVALVAGILSAAAFEQVEPAVWAVCCGVCFVVAAAGVRFRTPLAWVYAGLAVAFFGAFVGRFSMPQSVAPQGVRLSLEVELEESPTWRGGRAMHTSGRLVSFSAAPSSAVASGERLLVAFDTMYRFSLGDRIRFVGYVNPIDSLSGSYGRLMRARGFTGRTYISQYSAPFRYLSFRSSPDGGYEPQRAGLRKTSSLSSRARPPADERFSRYFFRRLQSAATSRLEKLGLKTDARTVAAAMTTGSRAGFSTGLRRAYSRTGASHLLAVSGLHVGVIFLIINGLLYLLPLVRGGRVLKNLLAVAAIWTYAAVAGMSASVMRAAVMFTGAQIAVALGVTRSAANVLCGAAVILLAVQPGLIFDISFQLSFLAVAGIMCWYSTIYRAVKSRWRVLNFLWSTLIVGFTASAATMPLVSHIFGVISPLGVLLNPILMVTAWVVVSFSAVWILLPFGFWAPLFRWLIGGAAEVQNAVVQRVSEIPGVAVEFRLSLWGVCAIYGALIMLTALAAARGRRPTRDIITD